MKLHPISSFLLLLCFCACSAPKESASPPNVIIIFTDDQGYSDLGSYGAIGFETPHIDTLAASGIRFTNFYVPATVCTPSRAALLTGSYPKRVGLHEAVLFPFSQEGLSTDEVTLAEVLSGAGMATACIGKWHLGHQPEFMPNRQGFDYFYGVPYSNDMDSYFYRGRNFQSPPLPLYENEKLIESGPDQSQLTRRYTEATTRYIEDHAHEPFFIYLAHNMPHIPLHASESFAGMSEQGLYGDVIQEIDWSVGEIVNKLKAQGIYENTIIVFTSDNGPHRGKGGGTAHPLRGHKASTWEGGQRVPGIISWSRQIPTGIVSNEIVNTMDLFPTLTKLTGSRVPEDLVIDGRDISEYLLSPESTTLRDEPFFYYARNGDVEAIRLGKWKLHIRKSIGWNKDDGEFSPMLFDLDKDMSETTDLAREYPDIVSQLNQLIEAFDRKLDKESRPVGVINKESIGTPN